jgi:hypothetical protein
VREAELDVARSNAMGLGVTAAASFSVVWTTNLQRVTREAERRTLADRRLRVGAVIAVGAAVTFLVWLLVRGDDDNSVSANTPSSTTPQNIVVPATAQSLRNLAGGVGRPIYWAGPRSGIKYELTQTRGGRIYIRYLPRNVAIGDRRGGYLIVATYPVQNAFKAVQTAARGSGAHKITLSSGGVAVYNDSSPSNVYFALPGSNYQIEVYDPKAAKALRLVTSGRITPIG